MIRWRVNNQKHECSSNHCTLDEDAIVEHIKKTALAASGCHLEIAQREVGTIHSDFERARRYIEIVRNTVEKYWKP